MEIRISNLDSATTEMDIRKLFSDYRIMLTSQIRTITTGAKMGTHCFVSIDNRAEAEAALVKLNGFNLRGSEVVLVEGR